MTGQSVTQSSQVKKESMCDSSYHIIVCEYVCVTDYHIV